eukprot:5769332-Prymnesium_polylepis.1
MTERARARARAGSREGNEESFSPDDTGAYGENLRTLYVTCAELRPGQVCEECCRQFPCVAVVMKRPEEAQARAAEWPGP